MIWTIRREALKVGRHGVCLSWHSRIALEAGALTAAGVSWRIVSASIKIQRPGRTCWEPNSGLLSTSIGTKMQTCGWRPDLCANGPQRALWARSEPQSFGENVLQCFASHLHCSQSCHKLLFDPIPARSSLWILSRLLTRASSAQLGRHFLHMRSGNATHGLLSHPPKCSQCLCTYVVSFFTCAMLQLHMWAGCVQAHAPKMLSWCNAAIGGKIRRKTRHPGTYLTHKMCSVLFFPTHPSALSVHAPMWSVSSHVCDSAATYVGRMCPGACAQDIFLMQCYIRWEDKTEDKAFKDISDTQNVQCIVCFFPTHPSALSVHAPMWSVSSHARCCSYICGQDVSRRMRPRYFPDAVLQ